MCWDGETDFLRNKMKAKGREVLKLELKLGENTELQ